MRGQPWGIRFNSSRVELNNIRRFLSICVSLSGQSYSEPLLVVVAGTWWNTQGPRKMGPETTPSEISFFEGHPRQLMWRTHHFLVLNKLNHYTLVYRFMSSFLLHILFSVYPLSCLSTWISFNNKQLCLWSQIIFFIGVKIFLIMLFLHVPYSHSFTHQCFKFDGWLNPFFRDELLAPVLHFVCVDRGERGLGGKRSVPWEKQGGFFCYATNTCYQT